MKILSPAQAEQLKECCTEISNHKHKLFHVVDEIESVLGESVANKFSKVLGELEYLQNKYLVVKI